jgi:hypothetical protein
MKFEPNNLRAPLLDNHAQKNKEFYNKEELQDMDLN